MNYIITGNSGLIGTFLKKELDKKHKCVLHIDQREGFNVLTLDGVKLNPNTQNTDILFHLAAHCKINEAVKEPILPHINNADGIFHVLEFARKNNIKKVMAFSSSRVLSSEENPYTASKKYLENMCEAYRQCYGIEYIIVRPSTVYGPIHDVTSRLLTNWVIYALQKKNLPIYGDKDKTLSFTHVSDFVDACLILLTQWDKAKNKAYNISGPEIKLTEVADFVIAESGSVSSEKVFLPQETAQPQKVKVDTSDLKELGWEPKVDIKYGIKELINFYRTEGIKWLS